MPIALEKWTLREKNRVSSKPNKARNRRGGNPTRYPLVSFYDIQAFAALMGILFGHLWYAKRKNL